MIEPELKIFKDDHRAWYLDNHLHREDGPAIIWKDGQQGWYQHGKRHRTDGPAIFRYLGACEWWIKGKRIDHLLEEACEIYDIPLDHNQWTDKDWVWFRLWVSGL